MTTAVVAAAVVVRDASPVPAAWPNGGVRVLWTTPVIVAIAVVAQRTGVVTWGGAAAGGLVALVLGVSFGAGGLVLLGAGLAVTLAATRSGHQRKAALGVAESRAGRRAAGNVIANTGVAAAAAFAALGSDPGGVWTVTSVAALVTGVSDTVATEIGQAWGGTPRLLWSWRRVAPGTPGAVSVTGLAAGAAGATALAATAALAGVIPAHAVAAAAAAAVIASLFEGVVAVVAEPRGWLDNDGVNLIATMAGAGLAACMCAGPWMMS